MGAARIGLCNSSSSIALELEVADVIAPFDELRDASGRHRVVRNSPSSERPIHTGAGLIAARTRDFVIALAVAAAQFEEIGMPGWFERSQTLNTEVG